MIKTKINYVHFSHVHNETSALEVLPFLFAKIHPKKVLDIGCGSGTWLSVAKKINNCIIKGIDGIKVKADMFEIDESEFTLRNLTEPIELKETFDLVICLEVAEHLPEFSAKILVETLTEHADIVLFSAAIPGQGGQNHLNEQPPKFWQSQFQNKGYLAFDILRDYFWDNSKVEWWYKQNMFIYAKPKYKNLFGIPSNDLQLKVHPDLLKHKVLENQHLLEIIDNRIYNPKIFFSFKLLLKSLFKKNS